MEDWGNFLDGLLNAAVSLIGIIVVSKNTRISMANKLDTNQQLMNAEIGHIKDEMSEMKDDIRTHNHYAQLFAENIPAVREQIKAVDHRLDTVEHRLDDVDNRLSK